MVSVANPAAYGNNAGNATNGATVLADLNTIIAEVNLIGGSTYSFAGAKTFGGASTFSSTALFSAAATFSSTAAFASTATFSDATGVTTDTVTERTVDAGVTIDGVLVKDSALRIGLAGSIAATAGDISYNPTTVKYTAKESAVRFLIPDYVCIEDQKASGTNGGSFSSGSWVTRTLNTEVADVGDICTLASNQFTLAAGTYRMRATAPAFAVDSHKAKLYNVTDSADVLIGTSAFSQETSGNTYSSTESTVAGEFTIASAKTFELRHRCGVSNASNGRGVAAGFSVAEVYTRVELWRVA